MAAILAFLESLPLWALGLFIFGLFSASAYLGRRLHKPPPPATEVGDPGLVVSASLGLLALLLGFTVSMAVGRYDARRGAVVQEANAIGTFVYRTDLMPADVRARTHALLDRYVEARVSIGREGEKADTILRAKEASAEAQQAIWREVLAVRQAGTEESVKILVVESANMMFDMATARDASIANRLPTTLVLLLIFFPVASLVLIGYVSGGTKGVHLMASTEMILLLTLVLLLVADLNRPNSGSIVIPQVPLLDVQAQLAAARTQPLS